MFGLARKSLTMPAPGQALPGRAEPIPTADSHFVHGRPLKGPYPEGLEIAYFALGCYWGAERLFWTVPGVWVTAVGNMGGDTPNPTYQELCTGSTGHAETVMVVYDPKRVSYQELLRIFFEAHDPTQGMRQGNDVGTQYRSAIYWTSDSQRQQAEAAKESYGKALAKAKSGHGPISTEIKAAGPFYFAEEYHQQYLAKNPRGYCGLQGTGVACQIA
jgi:peptide-methionine (S)-S-oxide reductase